MQRSKMDKTNEMNDTNDTEEPEPLLKNERMVSASRAGVSSNVLLHGRGRCRERRGRPRFLRDPVGLWRPSLSPKSKTNKSKRSGFGERV